MAMDRLLLLLVHLATVPLLVVSDVTGKNLAPGNPSMCLAGQPNLWQFEVLPGMGWDNLRNVEAGVAVSHNYSQCQTTDDGRFLIPDSVNMVPVKTSRVQTSAELMSSWEDYTSTTAASINFDAGASFFGSSISGKFSADFTSAKRRMIGDNSMITRMQIRYLRYTAKLQPDTPLSPALRHRLHRIATYLHQNQTRQARYAAQLLVRDFGTHVITSVDAGAIITQTDQVSSSIMENDEKEKVDVSAMLAAAGSFFFSSFHVDASLEYHTSSEMATKYTQKRMASLIESHGGPAVSLNMSLDSWAAAADKNLVAIDRHGDPLWYLLTPQSLPELSDYMRFQVKQKVKQAVNLYYAYNMYQGCTSPDKPNFSPAANMNDGTCETTATKFTLGGVFSSCTQMDSEVGNPCSGVLQTNPKTGDYSCPKGYTEVELNSGPLEIYMVEKKCECWWLWEHCQNIAHWSNITRRSVWCAAQGPVPEESSFLFGGLYTSRVVNPLTRRSSCPDHFYPIKLESDVYVCLSDDFEVAADRAVPFGGFFSCSMGNPMAMHTERKGSSSGSQWMTLNTYLQNGGSSNWPQRCPKGFSQHLAYVDEGCEINYCALSGALTPTGLLTIRRPPFMNEPRPPAFVRTQNIGMAAQSAWEKADPAVMYLTNSHTYSTAADLIYLTDSAAYTTAADMFETSSRAALKSSAPGHLSTRDTAIVAAASTLGCVALVTAAIFLRRRCMRRRENHDRNPLLTGSEAGYGAISPEDVVVTEN